MIPTPRPGNIPESPEKTGPPSRGSDPTPLILQSLEEIEELKKSVKALSEKMRELERRLEALEEKRI